MKITMHIAAIAAFITASVTVGCDGLDETDTEAVVDRSEVESPSNLPEALAQAQADGASWEEVKKLLGGSGGVFGCYEPGETTETCCSTEFVPKSGWYHTCCTNDSAANTYSCTTKLRVWSRQP